MKQIDKDVLDELFLTSDPVTCDDEEEELDAPRLVIDLDEVNSEAQSQAKLITERLSNYYFDAKYIKDHPYIPVKIQCEMQNIRRLLKMLAVNEKAQDSLITGIAINSGKGALYASLTSLQNAMLSIQRQLDELTTHLEDIFRMMQTECEKTFEEKQKEEDGEGKMVVLGSKDFIKMMTERLDKKKQQEENTEEDNQEQIV